jgi:S1-C subfamily serine protease
MQPGDQIVSINNTTIRENDDLFLHIGMALAGNQATIKVARNSPRGPMTFTKIVKLAKFYVPGSVIASNRPAPRFGLRVDHTSILVQRNPFPAFARAPAEGVLIREVVSNSPADKALLQPDKIITQVNGRYVRSPKEYYQEMAKAGKKVELTFLRSDGTPQKLSLEEK